MFKKKKETPSEVSIIVILFIIILYTLYFIFPSSIFVEFVRTKKRNQIFIIIY